MYSLLTCNNHQFAGFQAVRDFDFARAAQTHFDFNPLGGKSFAVGRFIQSDDILPAALRNNGFLGHDARAVPDAKYRIDPRKHAWAQLPSPVVNATPDAY